MPKPQIIKPRVPNVGITCAACGLTKDTTQFYRSYNPIHQTGCIPYCKSCLKDMISDQSGNVDMVKLNTALQLIDKPFIYDVWKSAVQSDKDSFGTYMKNLAMKQYRDWGWRHSQFEPIGGNDEGASSEPVSVDTKQKRPFILTDEIIEKWGAGYSDAEYEAFERKHSFLRNNYPEKTAMHTEALLNYVRYRVKEEIATASGDPKEAKDWAEMAHKAATAAKINPSQLSAADLQGGLNSFGELIKAVEAATDIIPILPQFKFRPNDALDFVIWCYVNYVRDLRGLPLCDYDEVYKFYDDRKREYIEQYGDPYGIFANDPTLENREKIKRFILMPNDFKDAPQEDDADAEL